MHAIMEDKVRIRLAFENHKDLRKSQRSEGLQCCWMLLRPEHQTISALSSFIVSSFRLQRRCPNGIVLSMDDFVLPSSETTHIFKDKDIIRIRKKDVNPRIINRLDACPNQDVPFKENEPKFQSQRHLVTNRRDGGQGHHEEKKNTCCLSIDPANFAGPSSNTLVLKRKRQDTNFHMSTRNDGSLACGYNGEERFASEAGKAQSRNARRKKEKRIWLRKDAASGRKEGHSSEYYDPQHAAACQKMEQSISSEDNIIPVVVAPGHIRFQSLGKSTDGERKQKDGDVVMCPLEVISCDKIQKENVKESTSSRLSDSVFEDVAIVHHVDFENLSPLTCFPKEGDVVAYKLVEFSSGYPEFSDFLVGQVSSFDSESLLAILLPVPGYPASTDKIPLSKKNLSIYKEDGSLEIDFMSLVDVRLVSKRKSDVAAANESKKACKEKMDQSSKWSSWDIKTLPCQNRKTATTLRNGLAENITNEFCQSNNWNQWLSGNSNWDTKVENITSGKSSAWEIAIVGKANDQQKKGSKSSITDEDSPPGWNSSTVKLDDIGKAKTNSGSEKKVNQGLDWDSIKSIYGKKSEAAVEAWPQWRSREYLANTSWSFLLRGPPPRPSKKRRSDYDNNMDAPRRNNQYKC